MWERVLATNGFWFAVGIVVGLGIEFGGTFFFDWRRRARLTLSLERIWPVSSDATVLSRGHPLHGKTVPITVYRFRVSNNGRRRAHNVRGTLEFGNIERRICWYEGNISSITLNAYDHSYLDVYGVIVNPQGKPTNDVLMPTENGWSNLPVMTLTAPFEVRLRVTAANARRIEINFYIDPTRGCSPVTR